MPNIVQQRIGPFSGARWYPETSPGVDPGSPVGYLLPLRAASSFQVKQGTVSVPVFNESMLPYGRMYTGITGTGTLPLNLELLTIPYLLKAMFGVAGYVKTTLVTGALHDFFIPSGIVTPLTGQIQQEFMEATAQYLRARYVRPNGFKMAFAASGPATMDWDFVGSGDSATTDLAGSKLNNGLAPINYFNGAAGINGINVVGMAGFSLNATAGVNATMTAFNGGVAGSVNPGTINTSGNAEITFATTAGGGVEADLTFYNYAANQQIIPLDCLWADKPLALMTSFMRVVQPSVMFDRASPVAGGPNALTVNQPYNLINDVTASKIAADQFGTVLGPYNISGTNNQFKYNIDGTGAVVYALTTGATRTVAQIVTELNADPTFSGKAVADAFGGYLRVTSKTKGTTSSVQMVTVASDSNATLGFIPTTSVAGYNTPLLIRVWCSNTAGF
jgi:hypothetical protein